MLAFKGKDFLIAKKFDETLSNVLKDIYGEKYKVSYIDDSSDAAVQRRKNYAEEIVNDAAQSGITKTLLESRYNTGTTGGIINGTDLVKHNMHQVAKNNYVNGLVLEEYDKNNDISQIMNFREENKRRFYHKFDTEIKNFIYSAALILLY